MDKCIVLDVDETLIHTFDREHEADEMNIEDPRNFDIRDRVYFLKHPQSRQRIVGVKRKYLDEFIRFCNIYFKHVIIWSAGEKDYVIEACRWIFKNCKKPLMILTREKCFGALMSKPLSHIFDQTYLKGVSREKTFIVDDRYESIAPEDMGNVIFIPRYNISSLKPEDIRSDNDDSLLRLIEYFQTDEVISSHDVRLLSKSFIFHSDDEA